MWKACSLAKVNACKERATAGVCTNDPAEVWMLQYSTNYLKN
jgi:hypothetical protein